ncbi:MAG: radical SAM protein [Planctomycetota bacterium]
MRVFLINPPTAYDEQTSLVEPLGLCYLAAAAKEAGHVVAVHDMVSTRHADVDRLFTELDAFDPQVVGLTAMTNAFGRALALARAVKARYGCTVVVGGWHVSGDPDGVLDPAIDFAVIGEGEDTFVELLGWLDGSPAALADIKGIAYERGGRAVVHERRARRRDLDALPRPDRTGLPLHLYQVPALLSAPLSRMRTLTIQASRGCPYRCTFCQTPSIWTNLWTRRTPAAVVDEIEDLIDEHGVDSIWIRDEEFTINRRWVLAICRELMRRHLPDRLRWGSFCRVDDIDREFAVQLAEAGYCYGFLGIDSGDPESRARIQKEYQQEEAERAFALFRELDITSHGGWIIGFPWDTRDNLEQQFAWIRSLPVDMLTVTYALPFAGTPFGEQIRRDGLALSTDFERFSEKEPVVRTPHIPTAELMRLRSRFIRRFYLRPGHLAAQVRRVARRPARLRIFAEMLWHHLRETRYFGVQPLLRRQQRSFAVPARWHEPRQPRPVVEPGGAAMGA